MLPRHYLEGQHRTVDAGCLDSRTGDQHSLFVVHIFAQLQFMRPSSVLTVSPSINVRSLASRPTRISQNCTRLFSLSGRRVSPLSMPIELQVEKNRRNSFVEIILEKLVSGISSFDASVDEHDSKFGKLCL